MINPAIPEIVGSRFMSVSDKIRELNRRNVPRAQIAQLLGKRYQHVRNVLEADKLKQRSASGAPVAVEGPTSTSENVQGPVRVEVGQGGELALPLHVRRALGVEAGGVIVARPTAEGWELIDCRTAARRARNLVRALNKDGVSLVDELIEERRLEAARENDH
jgi:hypothetical protein